MFLEKKVYLIHCKSQSCNKIEVKRFPNPFQFVRDPHFGRAPPFETVDLFGLEIN